jgi:chromosome partitioning protein
MSKIIAILNQKGGAGKTTLATNLARALQLNGDNVLLVDSDPQGSSRDWNAASDAELLPVVGLDRPTLAKDIQALINENRHFIIIDGAPQIAELAVAAIKCADVILIPVQPSPYDIWACDDLVEIIKARQEVTNGTPKAAFVISRVIKNTKLSKEIGEALEGYGLPVFQNFTSQRVVYPQSASIGSTVLDIEAAAEAAAEINAIMKELKEFLNGTTSR